MFLPPSKVLVERVEGPGSLPALPLDSQMAKLKKNERITDAKWFQDVRHIEFQLEGTNTSYVPAIECTMSRLIFCL